MSEAESEINDFDAEYERRLQEAQQRARAEGRSDVADYINLRVANDALRTSGIEVLLEAFTMLAGEANRLGAGINLSRQDAHRFRVGNSTMVGTQFVLRIGVRALTVEAGWPRTPLDGIVRGGGLACAQVTHFGDRAAGEELLLMPGEGRVPRWLIIERTGTRVPLSEDRLRRHFTKLIGHG